MLTVVTWLWSESGVRRTYIAEHVNTMRRMIARNLTVPHRVVCITDDPSGIEGETFPLWKDAAEYKQARGKSYPACYRRLKIFEPKTAYEVAGVGGRILSVDIDAVVVGNIDSLVPPEPNFVGWRVTRGMVPRVYNGSFFLHDAGAFPEIWSNFIADPLGQIKRIEGKGFVGSDQAQMAYTLGQDRKHWTAADGVLSYRLDKLAARPLPSNAKIVFYHGAVKPWDEGQAEKHKWVADHWR